MKVCTRCLIEQPLTEFYWISTRARYQERCKSCFREMKKAQPKQRVADIQRKSHIKKSYNLSITQYEEMAERQAGLCFLCDKPCATGQRLSVDHNHETGEVRGLLCRRCNTKLAALEDERWFKRASAYLGR